MNAKKILLPILIIGLAAGVTLVLVKSRKMPEPHETAHMGPLVDVASLVETARDVVVTSTGTVQPRHEVSITPQVRGKVVEISPRMIAGGVFHHVMARSFQPIHLGLREEIDEPVQEMCVKTPVAHSPDQTDRFVGQPWQCPFDVL